MENNIYMNDPTLVLKPSPILITKTLSRWIEALCGTRDHAFLSEEEAREIATLDPKETLCHVEFPGSDFSLEKGWTIPVLFTSYSWETNWEFFKKRKEKELIERTKLNQRVEKIDEVKEAIMKKLSSIGLDEKTCRDIAQQIVSRGNIEVAKQFGVAELLPKE